MPTIHIIGLGVAEKAQLSKSAQAALVKAHMVIGSERQLETVQSFIQQQANRPKQQVLPKLAELKSFIASHMDQDIAVLASGDPLYYGIGRWFGQHFAAEQLSFYPAISSIQAACHALGLSLQDVDVLSLHGRPVEKIRRCLKAKQTLVILTDGNSSPSVLAKECQAAGFAQSQLWVCEHLGYQQQNIRTFTVDDLLADAMAFDPLHITVIKTIGEGGVLPEFPGIPDTHYSTGAEPGKGMITKREVRLAILSLMQPANDDVIWDIGAGCGGLATELAYWNERATVYAIEYNQERLRYLNINRQRFGVVSNVEIIAGRAPAILVDLPKANKVFIGGSDGELEGLLTQVWQQLPARGLLVASAVTDKTKAQLEQFASSLPSEQVEALEIAVKKAEMVSGLWNYREKLPVSLFKFTK